MLNAVPTLTYEDVGPNANAGVGTPRRSTLKSKWGGRGSGHRPTKEVRPYYTFHYFYGHDISECRDASRSVQMSNSCNGREEQTQENPQQSVLPGRDAKRIREHSPHGIGRKTRKGPLECINKGEITLSPWKKSLFRRLTRLFKAPCRR